MAPRCAQKQDHETEGLGAACMGWCGEVSAKSVVHACRASGTQREPSLGPEKDVPCKDMAPRCTQKLYYYHHPLVSFKLPLLFRPILTQIFWDDRPVVISLASPRHFAACVTDLRQRLGCTVQVIAQRRFCQMDYCFVF